MGNPSGIPFIPETAGGLHTGSGRYAPCQEYPGDQAKLRRDVSKPDHRRHIFSPDSPVFSGQQDRVRQEKQNRSRRAQEVPFARLSVYSDRGCRVDAHRQQVEGCRREKPR